MFSFQFSQLKKYSGIAPEITKNDFFLTKVQHMKEPYKHFKNGEIPLEQYTLATFNGNKVFM